jgi:hypothetical protein
MKTADLTGALLSYWFACATGAKEEVKIVNGDCLRLYVVEDLHGSKVEYRSYDPQLLNQELFNVVNFNDIYISPMGKYADKGFGKGPRSYEASDGTERYTGPTLGEAICKAMIHKVYGTEVPNL